MALKRLVIDGYGQLELNRVSFPTTGRIEAQCALDATDFADVPAENGMLLAVDRANRTIKFATDGSLPVAINYTTEHMYDERKNALKDFALERGTFLPRMGFLSTGELFTMNTICYDSTEFAAEENLKTALDACATTAVYGGISSIGAVKVSKTKPTAGPVLKVVEVTTMPDGTYGVKFQVLEA